jgi:hypothetical protein
MLQLMPLVAPERLPAAAAAAAAAGTGTQQAQVLQAVEQQFVAGLRRKDGRTVGLGL